jgi:hypothetical protein
VNNLKTVWLRDTDQPLAKSLDMRSIELRLGGNHFDRIFSGGPKGFSVGDQSGAIHSFESLDFVDTLDD